MTDFERAGRRITVALLLLQALLSAGMSLVFVVASIITVDLAGGNRQWTGVPSTAMLVGAALIAYPIGRLMDSAGRRAGLSLGSVIGIAGGVLAGWGAWQRSLVAFLGGILLLGMGRGVSELGRYAAADASPPARRGRAISLVVLGGTVGSVAGPSLVALAARLDTLGLPDGGGLWLLVTAFYAVASLLMLAMLHPDPRLIAAHYAAAHPGGQPDKPAAGRSFGAIMADPRAILALGAMAFSQISMVVVMTITPVHMDGHQHPIGAISVVLMAHTLGMFGLSFVTGWLVDRFGRARMILAGALVSALACVLAPVSTDLLWLAVALFLLGLGWNFAYIGGSSLLDDTLGASEKGRIQGTVDAISKVASGVGSLGSGVVFAAAGYALTSWISIAIALIPALLVLVLKIREQPAVLDEAPAR